MSISYLKEAFQDTFGSSPAFYAAAPGRTEIGGNHTDHQHGCVLAAAVDLVTEAAISKNSDKMIRVRSEGYPLVVIDSDDLQPKESEKGSTTALIRGVAAGFAKKGYKVAGFDAYAVSTVLPGSGLSSSAAFEVLIGTVINHLFADGSVSPVEIAGIAQYAENVFFGKPCGLMDQMASSVGSIIGIDFHDNDNPIIERIGFDFDRNGYSLCIIDSGADHANLTDQYAAIPQEMRSVAKIFGREVLRDVEEERFYAKLRTVRDKCGDRATLRAIHFYEENKRVQREVTALKSNDMDAFLENVKESGRSSWELLQNVVPNGDTVHQNTAFALAVAEKLLDGKGACRVHGGGFAGTIQAFVPSAILDRFKAGIDHILGLGACHVLKVRPEGGYFADIGSVPDDASDL